MTILSFFKARLTILQLDQYGQLHRSPCFLLYVLFLFIPHSYNRFQSLAMPTSFANQALTFMLSKGRLSFSHKDKSIYPLVAYTNTMMAS